MKKKPILLVLTAVVVLGAAVAAGWMLTRPADAFRDQRRVASPVLKPVGVSERSFFFAPPYFLLRLNSTQPTFDWQVEHAQRGYLDFSFFAFPGPATTLTFVVRQDGGGRRSRKLLHEVVHLKEGRSLRRHFRFGVVLPADARLVFAVLPEAHASWPQFDIGMSVPRIDTGMDAPGPANLLIISIDALRSDALGIYQTLSGKPPIRSASPEIDRFAEEAVVFRNARTTQSTTWPALSSLHLSRYPKSHGVTANGKYLNQAFDSIADVMLERGYSTLSLMNNAYELNIPGFEEKRRFSRDGGLATFACKRIENSIGQPFFHWYHFWGVHANYKPPRWAMEYLEGRKLPDDFPLQYNTNKMMLGQIPYGPRDVEAVRGLYAGALVYTDSLLKKIFDELKRHGLWDKTLVIVTADHGEELHDHNRYFYHNPSLYGSAIRVPLLIKFPGQRRQHIVEADVSLLDVFPTLYDYFIAEPEAGHFAGRSLLKLLTGDDDGFRDRVLMAETEESQIAVAFSGRYKLLFNPKGLTPLNHVGLPFPVDKLEFYDLESDPGEHNKQINVNSNVRGRMLRAVEKFLREGGLPARSGKRGKVEITDEMKKEAEEKLRSLGYIR
jgi:choline-sulfatase